MPTSNRSPNPTPSKGVEAAEQTDAPLVTAIVSAYACERFMAGCLEDLLAQSLGDRLEIVVVVSGSPENEAGIVAEYQREHGNIKLLHTAERETIYGAWNRGVRAASGRYLTNANADDRRRSDALEILAGALDDNPDAALVYANYRITFTENETFDSATVAGRSDWPPFDPKTFFTYCYAGPQPMWRSNLHRRYGYFDKTMRSAGDYDFWLRLVSGGERFLLVPEELGLYYMSNDTAERRDKLLAREETLLAKKRNTPPWKREAGA